MSYHVIPQAVSVDEVDALAKTKGRTPSQVIRGNPQALVFTPDLTPGEVAYLADFLRTAASPIRLDPDTLAAISGDLTTGRTFLGLATPSNADAIGAVRALWRVVLALAPDS